jgi:hypothetical protein
VEAKACLLFLLPLWEKARMRGIYLITLNPIEGEEVK